MAIRPCWHRLAHSINHNGYHRSSFTINRNALSK
jgi:hypothetical protein